MALQMGYDSTIWSDQIFSCNSAFDDNNCNFTSKLGIGEPEWDETDMNEFLDSFDMGFTNEPQVEAMNSEAPNRAVTKFDELDIYNNSSAFLSPVSLNTSSPCSPQMDESFEQHLQHSNDDLLLESPLGDNTSAMDLLNKILASGSADNDYSDGIDTAINAVEYFCDDDSDDVIEVESNSINGVIDELIRSNSMQQKRQTKRKYSTDSRTSAKRSKRSNVPNDVRRERKKSQNKSAANRYRMKKRAEQETVEEEMEKEMKRNESLKQSLEKLQMEYKVVHPLANAAFVADDKRQLLLQMIHLRVLKDNLLD